MTPDGEREVKKSAWRGLEEFDLSTWRVTRGQAGDLSGGTECRTQGGGECARMLVCTTGLTRRGVEEEGLFTTPMLHCGSSSL